MRPTESLDEEKRKKGEKALLCCQKLSRDKVESEVKHNEESRAMQKLGWGVENLVFLLMIVVMWTYYVEIWWTVCVQGVDQGWS